MAEPAITIAQITDTHLFADPEQSLKSVVTARSLQAVVEQVRRVQPDLLLLTGDLSQDETLASYEQLRASIAPMNIPTYWIPGNHDRPELMGHVLSDLPFRSEKVLQQAGWSGVLLDSAVAGEVGGELSQECLRELDAVLQRYPDHPTFIALHHPVFDVGSAWMGEIGLSNAEDLLAVVDRHPQVKLVLFGHIHQEFERQRQGVTYLGTPSTCVQFKPHCETFTIDDALPGFRVLRLEADGRFETVVERVPIAV